MLNDHHAKDRRAIGFGGGRPKPEQCRGSAASVPRVDRCLGAQLAPAGWVTVVGRAGRRRCGVVRTKCSTRYAGEGGGESTRFQPEPPSVKYDSSEESSRWPCERRLLQKRTP